MNIYMHNYTVEGAEHITQYHIHFNFRRVKLSQIVSFRNFRRSRIFAFAPSSQPLLLMLKPFSNLGHPAIWGPKTNERASSS